MEAVGIVSHLAALCHLARLEQFDEAEHDGGILRGDIGLIVECGMKVVEVEYHELHGRHQRLLVEAVAGHAEAPLHEVEVLPARALHLGREVHHGVDVQRHLPLRPIVALRRRAEGDELGEA